MSTPPQSPTNAAPRIVDDEPITGRIYAHFHQYGNDDLPVLIDLMAIDGVEARETGSVVHTLSGVFSVKESYREVIQMLESLVY